MNAEILRCSIDEWEWSVRTRQCFRNAGIETVADLVAKTEADLLRMPNFAQKSLNEVKGFLVDEGLRLGMDVPNLEPKAARIQLARRVVPPRCVATVKVSSIDTQTRRYREQKARARGLPIAQCGEYAAWRVDGHPLCLTHAGRRALAILAGEA